MGNPARQKEGSKGADGKGVGGQFAKSTSGQTAPRRRPSKTLAAGGGDHPALRQKHPCLNPHRCKRTFHYDVDACKGYTEFVTFMSVLTMDAACDSANFVEVNFPDEDDMVDEDGLPFPVYTVTPTLHFDYDTYVRKVYERAKPQRQWSESAQKWVRVDGFPEQLDESVTRALADELRQTRDRWGNTLADLELYEVTISDYMYGGYTTTVTFRDDTFRGKLSDVFGKHVLPYLGTL